MTQIRFTRADEPLTIGAPTCVIYGAPGVGKTTLALTARRPLLVDFDRRGAQAAVRAPLTLEVGSWPEAAALPQHAILAEVETIVVDTVGRALETLTATLLRDKPKLGRRDGTLTLEGYGALKAAWAQWLRALRATGKGLVLVAHSTERTTGDGEGVVERLDIVGSSRDLTYQVSDVMGRVAVRDGGRVWITRPSEGAYGKDPMGDRPDRVIPPIPERSTTILGEWLAEIVAHVQARSQAAASAADAITAVRAQADACATPEALTALARQAAGQPAGERAAILASAEARGWAWDRTAGAFTQPAEAVPVEA